jgi:nucleotide-binding universal stress UspA family protein
MSDDKRLIRHILVPHDFSETAESALEYALGLAQKVGATVTVMHSYELPTYGFPESPVMSAEVAGQIERASRAALSGIASRASRPGVDLRAVLRQGVAWSEIVALAKETNVDLLVMGTHGRRGIARMLLGSVAEKVVRAAPCPVLTVRGSTLT